MRHVLLVAIGLLTGCSLAFRLDVTREPRPTVTPPPVRASSPPTSGQIGTLLRDYRAELDRYCDDQVLTAIECATHRRHLLDLLEATATASIAQQQAAATALSSTAATTPHPTAQSRLGSLALAVLRLLRP